MNRLRRTDSGAALAEFALVTPVFLLIFAGMADFAMLFRSYQVATNAAREGARLAILQGYEANGYETPESRAAAYMNDALGSGSCGACAVADPVTILIGTQNAAAVRVRVSYTYNFMYIGKIVGLVGGTFRSNLPFQVQVTMRREASPLS
jgi:Flp pilus assembly protein TadG